MAKTLSTMLELGTTAPAFSLRNPIDNKKVSLDQFAGARAYLVMFICNHCPFVIHVREKLVDIATQFIKQGVAVIAINSNDVSKYPDDSPDNMVKVAKEFHFPFHYLYDEDQTVAKAYKAACTPDFFLFDRDKKLVYRGQMDNSRPGNNQANDGADLIAAVEATLAGKKPSEQQVPSMGCNIKWKPGNEPAYLGS